MNIDSRIYLKILYRFIMVSLRIIVIIICIYLGFSCTNKGKVAGEVYDVKLLPSKWVELSVVDGKQVICMEADIIMINDEELIHYFVSPGEKSMFEVIDSYRNNDTVKIHVKWKHGEGEMYLKLVWLDKDRGIAQWFYGDEDNTGYIFVADEKSGDFEKIGCDTDVSEPDDIGSLVSDINDFVGGKWEIADAYYGDLNKDGQDDVAIVAVENDLDNIIIQPELSLGPDTLYTSPRMLMVALKEGEKYRMVAKNKHFLPPANDVDQPCLAEPLSEPGGISISKGVLTISLHYWYSCGSWYVSDDTYVFRYQNDKMQLIGFSSSSFHRSSGEMASVSVNYSTKKKQTTTGGNMFDEELDKPQDQWENIKINQLFDLDEMNDEIKLY